MSDKSRSRRRKFCICGLVLLAVMLSYPLSVGPWIYMISYVPAPVQQFLGWYYYPIDIAPDSFWESPVGELYIEYMKWWDDLPRG